MKMHSSERVRTRVDWPCQGDRRHDSSRSRETAARHGAMASGLELPQGPQRANTLCLSALRPNKANNPTKAPKLWFIGTPIPSPVRRGTLVNKYSYFIATVIPATLLNVDLVTTKLLILSLLSPQGKCVFCASAPCNRCKRIFPARSPQLTHISTQQYCFCFSLS